MESSAQLSTTGNHTPLHLLTPSEFPMFEDITIGAYRTSPSDRLNGLLDYENFDCFTLTDIAHGYQEHAHVSTTVVNNDAVISNSSSIHSEFHKDLEAMCREEHELLTWYSRFNQQDTDHTLLQVNGNSADFCLQLETNNYAELLLDTITDQVGLASGSEFSHSNDSSFLWGTRIKKQEHVLSLDESSVPDLPDGQELSPMSMYEGVNALPLEINRKVTEEYIVHTTPRVSSAEIKRRCRKFELQRSRPRDRQLIQDRMKELRQLLNASECSIDALLDKTVTYMQFLQSVSEKAEKIHNTLDVLEPSDETKKQLESFPLRTEELDQPGHILIEMLCEDYEMFLDTAHVLKRLEVTILKGVLEYRSDKPWARFVIEASEGFNHMQVLCPLMHLLGRR